MSASARRTWTGSEAGVVRAAHHVPTASSRRASRQRSARGKSCAGSRPSDKIRVACAHLTNKGCVADGPFFVLASCGKRALRYGKISEESASLIASAVVSGFGAESMNDVNFESTASRAGTCLNRIGSVDNASKAGMLFWV